MGVHIYTNTSVESISHENQKVNGVHTKNEFYESDVVICNQDIYFVYERLLKKQKSCSGIKTTRTFNFSNHFLLGY